MPSGETHTSIVFDDGLADLAPLTDLRPAFDVRVAAFRNIERLRMGLRLDVAAVWVPEPLAEITADRHAVPINAMPDHPKGPVLLVNGRCPIPDPDMARLEVGHAMIDPQSEHLIAARLEHGDARRVLEEGWAAHASRFEKRTAESVHLLTKPWQFRAARDEALEMDLRTMLRRKGRDIPRGVTVLGDPAHVVIDRNAEVRPGVVLDAESGPVVISTGAEVRPGAILVGPLAIGPGSTVRENAVIRGGSAIGPTCKVGGELGGVVFQGFANKAHDGYLGDAWVGEWVNLGAATTASNLLNTYGDIPCQQHPGEPRERTGEMYLGPMLGDHAKTAIGTRLMTGSIIHTGAMIARSAPIAGSMPRFAWATDRDEIDPSAPQPRYELDRFLDVARTVMSRREQEPTAAYMHRLAALHEAEQA
ncbi:MAG: putative sugar nucleotidyl transferase [Planctomycetota bacterium]